MLQLTVENKELKRRMVEWIELQNECQELKKKEEAWNDGDHAYYKTLIKYKHKVEGLEREREPWL
jgi:hypothetical protein